MSIFALHERQEGLGHRRIGVGRDVHGDLEGLAASKIFAKAFGTDPEFAELGCGNIWFATLGDEENFFGMTSDYMGMKLSLIHI